MGRPHGDGRRARPLTGGAGWWTRFRRWCSSGPDPTGADGLFERHLGDEERRAPVDPEGGMRRSLRGSGVVVADRSGCPTEAVRLDREAVRCAVASWSNLCHAHRGGRPDTGSDWHSRCAGRGWLGRHETAPTRTASWGATPPGSLTHRAFWFRPPRSISSAESVAPPGHFHPGAVAHPPASTATSGRP